MVEKKKTVGKKYRVEVEYTSPDILANLAQENEAWKCEVDSLCDKGDGYKVTKFSVKEVK